MTTGADLHPPETPPAQSLFKRIGQLGTIIGAVLVMAVALWQSAPDLQVTRFHPDESRWINRAQHLAELQNPLSSYWADQYLIRGQPPMGSYITGLGLVLQGYDLDSTGPWNFSFGNESDINWNVAHGNVPSADYLMAARNTSVVIGMLTCLSLFLIVTMLTNWIGGTVAGVFFAVHPLTVYLSTLAVSDAAFTFMVSLSVLATIWLARKPGWGRAILLGVVFGVGASLKLSPMFVSMGLAAIGLLILAGPFAFALEAVASTLEQNGRTPTIQPTPRPDAATPAGGDTDILRGLVPVPLV